MRKLLYVEDGFLDPPLCQSFIDLFDKEDSFVERVTHSNPNESLTANPDIICARISSQIPIYGVT